MACIVTLRQEAARAQRASGKADIDEDQDLYLPRILQGIRLPQFLLTLPHSGCSRMLRLLVVKPDSREANTDRDC